MVTALDSPNPEKQKLSKQIADDIARFLENGGQIQVIPVQKRSLSVFDREIPEEVREAQRRRGAKARRGTEKRPKYTLED